MKYKKFFKGSFEENYFLNNLNKKSLFNNFELKFWYIDVNTYVGVVILVDLSSNNFIFLFSLQCSKSYHLFYDVLVRSKVKNLISNQSRCKKLHNLYVG
jgi:hypothetical protein